MTVEAVRLPLSLKTAIGSPSDSTIDLLKKLVLLGGNLGGYFFSMVLATIYFIEQLYLPAILAVIYLAVVSIVYVYYFRTRQLNLTASLFSSLLFLELVVTHLSLGGFRASGTVFIWVAASAIMAIITTQIWQAAAWMVLFLLSTTVFTILEPQIAAAGPPVSEGVSRLLFGLNFGFGLTYMIANSFYFMYLIELERQRADNLLLNILPYPVARRLKEQPGTIADGFDEASILFADIVDSTRLCADADPADVVEMLNSIFSDLDELVEEHGLEKIKTTGDGYMVAAGLPEPRPDHCEATAAFAFDMLKVVSKHIAPNGEPIQIRIGLNTGPVVAGVLGRHRFIYDLWGDAVNMASRMESHGLADTIQVTEEVKDRLADRYTFERRGPIRIKGKGEMVTYLMRQPLSGVEAQQTADQTFDFL